MTKFSSFFKKTISILLCQIISFTYIIPVFAEGKQNITSPDQSGKSDITATIEASNFDVTVPLGLPLYLHPNGSVTTATDAKIENNSQGPVIIKNVKLTPVDNWKLASFTDNYKTKKVNSKELGFQIMNENVLVDGSINMKAEDWPSIPGNGDLPLNYDGKVPIRSSDGITTAANLELTFDWDRLSDEIYTVNITSDENGSAYIDTEDKPITGSYHYGDTINLANASKTGYHFVNYTDQNDNIISSPYTIRGPVTIKANFEANTYTVTANDDGNGSVSGGKDYKYGEQATLIATPNEHYHFTNWTDGDSNVISDQSVYTFTVTDNIDYTAHFDIDQFNVTLTSDEHGNITGAESGTYDYGTELSFIAVPTTGYHFVNYTDSDGNVVNSPYTVTKPVTIKANFEINTYTVNINKEGNGTVNGSGDYTYNSTVTLKAVPDVGYKFVGWKDKDNNIISTDLNYLFNIVDNTELTAVFAKEDYTVSIINDGHGSAYIDTADKPTTGTYNYGNQITLTNTPATGYHFVNYTDENGNVVNSPYTVTDSITIKANFEANTYTVTANDDGNGTTGGNGNYKYGEQATLTAIPNEHYHFTNWTDENNDVVSNQSVYSFTVTENIDYTAHFDIDQFNVILTSDEHGNITGASSGTYDYGTKLNITAVPDAGYHFVNYTDEDGNVVNSPYTVTDSITIKANFEANTYTVTANDDGNGTTGGNGNYKYGEQATLTATPNEHYHFINWTDDNNTVISDQSAYSFTVTENIDYTAHFKIDQFTATFAASTGGSITGAESGIYDYGTELNITAVPDTGYKFTKWSDNDTNADKTITVTSDINLTADFNIAYQNLTRYNYKGINYDLKDNGTASVSEGTYNDPGNTDLSGNISISDTVIDNNGLSYSVTSIGNDAFYNCSALTSIVIPDSVTSIGYDAFAYCHDLTDVTIPDSVTYIGDYAFEYCHDLTDITIPDSVTSIGDYAFAYCISLTDITIPDSVTYVGYNAFDTWKSNQTINIEGKSSYQDTIDAGWDEGWNKYCNAQINYLG